MKSCCYKSSSSKLTSRKSCLSTHSAEHTGHPPKIMIATLTRHSRLSGLGNSWLQLFFSSLLVSSEKLNKCENPCKANTSWFNRLINLLTASIKRMQKLTWPGWATSTQSTSSYFRSALSFPQKFQQSPLRRFTLAWRKRKKKGRRSLNVWQFKKKRRKRKGNVSG